MKFTHLGIISTTLLLAACSGGGGGGSANGGHSGVDSNNPNALLPTTNACQTDPEGLDCVISQGPWVILMAGPFDMNSLLSSYKTYASHTWKRPFGWGSTKYNELSELAFTDTNPMQHQLTISAVDVRKLAQKLKSETAGITDKSKLETRSAEVSTDYIQNTTEKHRVRAWLSHDNQLGHDVFLFQMFYDFSPYTAKKNLVTREQMITDLDKHGFKMDTDDRPNMQNAIKVYENTQKHVHPEMAVAFSTAPDEAYDSSKSTIIYPIKYTQKDDDFVSWQMPPNAKIDPFAPNDAANIYQNHIKGKTPAYTLQSHFNKNNKTIKTVFTKPVFDAKCLKNAPPTCTYPLPAFKYETQEYTADVSSLLYYPVPYDGYIIYEYVSLTNGDTDYVAVPIRLN